VPAHRPSASGALREAGRGMGHPHIVVLGAGAVGGFLAATMARAGEDVTIVDPWAEHVERIREHGFRVSGTQGDHTVNMPALHVGDVQRLISKPIDIALIATKAFDTGWAAMLLRDYLRPTGFVVSLQNGFNEEQIAAAVGWGRTLGCVVNTLGVRLIGPGHVHRDRTPGGASHKIFRLGEINGLVTRRAQDLARRMEAADSAMVTPNLWGERWSKLTVNVMQMGVLAATGLTKKETIDWETSRRVSIRAAAEGILVGRALGFQIEPIIKTDPDVWLRAADGEAASLRSIDEAFEGYLNRLTPEGRNERDSMGRDALAGRRTEVEFLNGHVAAKGEQVGVAVPVNRGIVTIIKAIERGEIKPARENILPLCN
jgi:2-dehydropantoate 2-reductase